MFVALTACQCVIFPVVPTVEVVFDAVQVVIVIVNVQYVQHI